MYRLLVAAVLAPALALAQSSCSSTVSASLPAPSVAQGYEARLIANGLTDPRGIVFDSAGHLLVVEQDQGVTALTLQDDGDTCLTVSDSHTVVDDNTLNHGLTISADGKTLYASSTEAVYSYPYNAQNAQADTDNRATLVNNMTTSDHTTRTLLLSSKVPGTLIVTVGSTSNVDPLAEDITTGHSQIKAFNLNNRTGTYDFTMDGLRLAWGVRNEVGIAEEPTKGGIYGVENSVDQMTRDGEDVHEDNPGEELNYFGTLQDNTSPNQGGNFGYPQCYSAWQPSDIPSNQNIKVGTQFAIDDSGANDTFCQQDRIAPRITFLAHQAPLDIKFDTNGRRAWITYHGSWDRTDPAGYKVSIVEFENGEPVEPPTSTTAQIDIVSNPDNSQCPDNCFRPVGMAFDSVGRLFFSSDKSGEIYVVRSMTGLIANGTDTAPSIAGGAGSSPTGGATPGQSGAASQMGRSSMLALIAGVFVAAFAV